MPVTVPFTFRIKIEDRKALEELYRLYGSPSPGAFLSEMTNAIVSGDQRKVAQFIQRLIMKAGEQMVLQLEAQAKQAQAAKQVIPDFFDKKLGLLPEEDKPVGKSTVRRRKSAQRRKR